MTLTSSDKKVVIINSILFNGPLSSLLQYAKPLLALRNIDTFNGTTDYLGVAELTGLRTTDYLCQHKGNLALWSSDVKKYDIPAMRKWYNLFDQMVNTEEALSASGTLIEQYSNQAVVAVPEASTAYAGRKERLIPLYVYLSLPPV